MHERYGTITPAIAAFAISGLLCSAQTLAQNAYIPGQLDNTVSAIGSAYGMMLGLPSARLTP